MCETLNAITSTGRRKGEKKEEGGRQGKGRWRERKEDQIYNAIPLYPRAIYTKNKKEQIGRDDEIIKKKWSLQWVWNRAAIM